MDNLSAIYLPLIPFISSELQKFDQIVCQVLNGQHYYNIQI